MELPQCGDLFDDRYRLDEVLGEGGSAIVFRAQDKDTHRTVALKLVRPDGPEGYGPRLERRFHREARIIANLRDRHTVTLFRAGESSDGFLFMVFEFVDGVDLAALLRERGRLDVSEAVHVMEQVLSSLREAHASGLLHRDIKPENIRIFASPDDPLSAKLLDFGIAKPARAEKSITKTGEMVGTPRYMSPEALLEQPLTAAADVYSVGIVAMEMLFGRDAIHGNRWDEQFDRLQTGHVFAFPDIERVPPELRRIIDRMVELRVEDRYGSANAVLVDLQAADVDAPDEPDITLEDPPSNSSRQPTTTAFRRVSKTNRRSALIGVGLTAVVLTTAIVSVLARRTPEPPPVQRKLPSELTSVSAAAATLMATHHDAGLPDAAAPTDAADATVVVGCGSEPPFLETGTSRVTVAGEDFRATVRVPGGYDKDTRYPVIVLFHHDDSSSPEFITQTRIWELADARGAFVMAMHAQRSRAWRIASDVAGTRPSLDQLSDEFCIDESRVFLLGHGSGSMAVDWLSCEPWVTAVATASYLPRKEGFRCEPLTPRPAIHIAPSSTRHVPIEGGKTCGLSSSPNLPLTTFESMWTTRNHCKEGSTSTEYKDGACSAFKCDAPFVSCTIDGGFGWPGSPPRGLARDPWHCDGTPSSFPSTDVIWQFFFSVPPLKLDVAP